MATVDPAILALFFGLAVGLLILGIIEVFVLRGLKIAESPKHILYPVIANILTLLKALKARREHSQSQGRQATASGKGTQTGI
ncbi:MAG: hypothetical protein HKN33_14490 [Pyrinomonadaceae bacterium]|nr:hypothetical protein [Pyrinomonadaceae bacterium]